jgi:hypothetical protein
MAAANTSGSHRREGVGFRQGGALVRRREEGRKRGRKRGGIRREHAQRQRELFLKKTKHVCT